MDSTFSPEQQPLSVSPAPSIDLNDLKSTAEQALQDAKVKFDELLKDGQEYIKQNPGKSVLVALGLGFVIGMIFKD